MADQSRCRGGGNGKSEGTTCTTAKPPIPYDQKPAEHRPADPLLIDDHRSENAERDACPDEMAQRARNGFISASSVPRIAHSNDAHRFAG
jgi:hypothetical protein